MASRTHLRSSLATHGSFFLCSRFDARVLALCLLTACSLPHSEAELEAGGDPSQPGDGEDGGEIILDDAGRDSGTRSRRDATIEEDASDPTKTVPEAGAGVDPDGGPGALGEGGTPDSGPLPDCPGGQARDCRQVCGGSAVVDDCNVCDGKNASKDCAGMCGGSARADCSGVCNGPNKPRTFYRDLDGDNLGDPRAAQDQCTQAAGYVANRDDCDDARRGLCTPTDVLRFKRKIVGSGSLPWNQNAISGLGDLDNDSVPDLVAADRIVLMNANGSVKSTRRIVAADLGVTDLRATFGRGVAALGDVNGDSIPDVAISEPTNVAQYFDRPVDVGRIWVLLLNRAGVPTTRVPLPAPLASVDGCDFGSGENLLVGWAGSIAAFDLEGDGRLELAASTTTDCAGPRTVTGRVDLYRIATNGVATRFNRIAYDQAPYTDDEFFGCTLRNAGDVNADGATDLTVATPNGKLWTLFLTRAGALTGTARLSANELGLASFSSMTRVFGALSPLSASIPLRLLMNLPTLTPRGGFIAARPAAATGGAPSYRLFYPKELNVEAQVAIGDKLGESGAALGDLENDGLPELLITAPGDDSGGTDLGAAYLLGFAGDCSNQSLRGDCNATAADGCETTLTTVDNCGACGRSCTGAANSTGGTCTATGTCALTCAANFGDCNNDVRDGCETDLRSSVDHCGSCTTKCTIRNHALPTCSAGTCGVSTTCETLWNDCNSNPSDGCEACGICGQERGGSFPAGIAPPAAACGVNQICRRQTWRANSGQVGDGEYAACVTSCPVGRGDCNNNPADGCEANLSLQSRCGSCSANAVCGVWSYLEYCVLNDSATNYVCR